MRTLQIAATFDFLHMFRKCPISCPNFAKLNGFCGCDFYPKSHSVQICSLRAVPSLDCKTFKLGPEFMQKRRFRSHLFSPLLTFKRRLRVRPYCVSLVRPYKHLFLAGVRFSHRILHLLSCLN
ncbi:hypothetical protein L596_008457 [Steinernema carpocapsae]|uniref:Uncharacterized protein n=1 Tax=Steinernema carpocapsae TaxID=34508 RepID=A0A4U5PCJ5_STECR|nr:hypothetical protein L596_008457 [Steinernema carpocapsae]